MPVRRSRAEQPERRSGQPLGRNAVEGRLRLGAIASIVALLVHGIVDAGVYVALPAPLLFAATAAFGAVSVGATGRSPLQSASRNTASGGERYAVSDAAPDAASDDSHDNDPVGATGRSPLQSAPAAPSSAAPNAIFNLQSSIFNRVLPPLALALLLLAALLPPVRAAFLANLGAVAQSKAELSRYEWPRWGIQDELRRSGEIDLAPAVALYRGSLRLNPRDPVANRRLGQISLSLGDYEEAGRLLSAAAGAVGRGDRPVAPTARIRYTNIAAVRLYGEWLAIEGRTAEAAALWRTVDVSQGQLDARAWWYDHIGEPARASFIRAAAARTN